LGNYDFNHIGEGEFIIMGEGKTLKGRVAVTGLGVISPVGIGKDAFWHGVLSGKSGIGPVTFFDASTYPCKIAAEVGSFDPTNFMSPKEARRSSRNTHLSIAATALAIEDSGLNIAKGNAHDIGIVYGTALGPMDIIEKFCVLFYERGLRRVNPFFLGMINKNATIGAIAKQFGIKGFHLSLAAGCGSGNVAVATAHKALLAGEAEVIIAGGVDTPISPSIFGLYSASQALASVNGNSPEKAMCPYDKRRSGFILGEGAGTLVLETMEHAVKRGARIYCEIISSAMTNDADDAIVFSPDATEMIRAYEIALKKAEIALDEVDYICAHAHSSVILDKKETEVIKKVFGQHAYHLAVSTIKAAVGHSMAGGTAMQSAAACLALKEGVLPPTINYEIPDPECDLDYIPNQARRKNIKIAFVDSFGLGGTNVVIGYRKSQE